MKHFKKPDNTVWAFELDGSQDHLITDDMMAISELEVNALLAPSLANLKTAKAAAINQARLTANFTTFQHEGKTFACDALSRSDIDGTNGTMTLTGGFPPGWPGGWKAVDNTYIQITTRLQWEAFYLAMCAQGATNFGHAQGLKATLAAATTAEQVAAITW